MLEAVRTPDERFEGLPGWPYAPNYLYDLKGYEGLRAHYIDEGLKDADHTFLCLHGEPSWAYLYRKMIPHFLNTGARVVTPDFFGFGRSDKPVDDEVYNFHFHRNYLLRFIERLNLQNITLVVQDWGGLLGLTLPHEAPERYKRLIVMNTTLAVGDSPGEGFDAWKAYAAANPDLPVGQLLARSSPHLTEAEIAAYDAPFPDISYKAGARRFPQMVMVEPDMQGVEESKRAVKFWSEEWNGDSFMAIGAADPVLGMDVMEKLRANIKGCPEPLIIEEGGHFLQEWGDEVAKAALGSFQ